MRGTRRTLIAAVAALAVFAGACSSDRPANGDGEGDGAPGTGQMVAQIATYQHLVGDGNRVLVGLIAPDGQHLVTFGSVTLRFSYLGTAEEPLDPEPGPEATATYLPLPGTEDDPDASSPLQRLPSEARGVYEAGGLAFDRAGFWQVEIEAEVEGLGPQRASATLAVLEEPATPAPGDRALETENLTLDDVDEVPPAAIDSRAELLDGEIPDPRLHRTTIAETLRKGRPALVLFSTPVYCVSRFCGPMTDTLAALERRYRDRAAFIMVEIWKDFQEQVVNRAAADWLLRDGELNEPVLFLIGPDGVVLERWDNVFGEAQVADALERLPA